MKNEGAKEEEREWMMEDLGLGAVSAAVDVLEQRDRGLSMSWEEERRQTMRKRLEDIRMHGITGTWKVSQQQTSPSETSIITSIPS